MKARWLLLVVVLIVSALFIGWLYDGKLGTAPQQADFQIPDNIDYYLSQVDYRAMDEAGKLDYRLQTPRLEHYIRQDISSIEQPRVELIGTASHWRLRASQATLQHQQERFELVDQVTLKRQSVHDPLRLDTSLMILLARDKLLDIPQSLTLQTATLDLQADSAKIYMDTDLYQFEGVKATYQPVSRDTSHDDS